MSTHRIRLRGSWETTSDAGHTTHTRRFGRPRTLEPGERVWLVCDSIPAPAAVLLNGTPVGTTSAPGPLAVDVTSSLSPRNEVRIGVASAEPLGEVVLEIRSPEAGFTPG
jgi:hypothetical protein